MRIIVLLLSLIVTRHLFASGFFPIHDTTHVARLFLMQDSFSFSNLPPLWADSANQGYGYPLFHFYSPLAYYVALFFKLIIPSYLVAVKASFILGVSLAGLGMYKLCLRWGRGVAFLSSAVYLLAPYLALDLYVRGALAEIWAIALLPWVFWAWRSLSPKASSIIRAAIITSLFLLSHNLIPLITAPFLLVWIICYQYKNIRSVFLASLLTLALSSFYLAPLLFERDFVQVSEISRTTDYSLHFVEPWQMWNSTWGFGGSAPGIEDGISFKLGKLNILLAIAGVVALIRNKQYKLKSFLAVSTLVAVAFTTNLTSFIWDKLIYLQMVQFPWRFISLITFFLAILAGFSVSLVKNKVLKSLFILVSLLALLTFNLKYFAPQSKLEVTDATYLESDYIPMTLAHIVPEYLPAWMPEFPALPAPAFPTSLEGPASYSLPRAYYPTWQATLNGINTPISATDNGLIAIEVPAGSHDLELVQVHTPLEKYSLYLSLVTIASLAIYLVWQRKLSK